MVRLFYSQKTEQVLKKMELTYWRELIKERQSQKHQDLSDNWKLCAIGERVKIEGNDLSSVEDLSPEAIKLGYAFSVAIQERDIEKALEIIEAIENLPSIWRNV